MKRIVCNIGRSGCHINHFMISFFFLEQSYQFHYNGELINILIHVRDSLSASSKFELKGLKPIKNDRKSVLGIFLV